MNKFKGALLGTLLLAAACAGGNMFFAGRAFAALPDFTAALRLAGAEVIEVPVYRWVEPEDTAAPEPTETPREWALSDRLYTVKLGVYDQIKDELSLGLNGSDCELISVETQADDEGAAQAFTLVMRRFGHGVGMSQRGAQWMAGHYGMNWQQIIGFYYPGLSVQRMAWPEDALTELDALPDSVGAARPKPTPTPTPAPLPALKAGERYATVNASALNLREQPTTAARVVDRLSLGRRLIVSGEANEDGWVAVHTAELEGFVKEEYLNY